MLCEIEAPSCEQNRRVKKLKSKLIFAVKFQRDLRVNLIFAVASLIVVARKESIKKIKSWA